MERLTYNEVLAKQYYPNENIDNEEIFNKLGKLEDIEEELGIPLEVLFKALKEGIYYFNHRYNEVRYARLPQFYSNEFHGWVLHDGVYSTLLKIKDYGKTWWLEKPKEELENAKD